MLRVLLICVQFLTGVAFAAQSSKFIDGQMTVEVPDFDEPVKLEGEWHFYWRDFLSSTSNLEHKHVNLDVPGHWEKAGFKKSGWGTYHGHITIPDLFVDRNFKILLPLFNGSTKVYVECSGNSQLVLQNGVPSDDPNTSVMSMASKTGSFTSCKDMDIFVQVSNLLIHPGGITYPVKIGTEKIIDRFIDQGIEKNYLLLGFFAFAFIFNFSIFLQRPEDKASLFLALFTLVQGLRFVSTEALIYRYFPDESNWKAQFNLRLMITTSLGGFVLKLEALLANFPNLLERKTFKRIRILIGFGIIMGVLIPITGEIWSVGLDLVAVLASFILVYLLYSYIRSLTLTNKTLILSFIGFAVYLGTMIYDGISLINGSEFFIAHFGLMIFIVVQSQVTGVQYAQSFFLTKRLKDELETKNKQILEKEKARTLFFHNTSHELRTPLNGILGFTQLLQRGNYGQLPEKANLQIAKISNLANSLMVQVNTILDIAMNRKGELKLVNAQLPIDEIVQDIHSLAEGLQVKYPNATFSLTTSWKQGRGPIMVSDREKIGIVLRNLVGNAFKFSLSNSTNHVNIRLSYFHRRLEISVSDTGIGIQPENVHKIFEEFTQLHGDSRRAFEGTGLGLSMVKAIVELMAGSIQVRSTLGEGSTFTIVLPDQLLENVKKAGDSIPPRSFQVSIVGDNQKSSKPVPQPAEIIPIFPPHGNTKTHDQFRVLVVDDNEVNREIISEILISSGFQVEMAKGGAEALKMIRNHKPDLVLLDLMMPEVSGEDVMKQLKSEEAFASLPIILLTARASDDDRLYGLSIGADDYLPKPIVTDELLLRVSNTLSRMNYARDAAEKEMIETTLETLQQVYTSLSHISESLPSIRARKYYQAAEQTGGDWFSFESHEETKRLYLFIGDVTGHGMVSAIVTVVAAGAVNAALTSIKKLGSSISKEDALTTIAESVNKSLTESGEPLKRSMTMGLVCLDLETGEGYYVNAGHNHIIVAGKDEVYALKAAGNPLGLGIKHEYVGETFQLSDNDTLFLYTDGLIENKGPLGDRLTPKLLRKILSTIRDPEKIKLEVLNQGRLIWKNAKAKDDTAFLVVQWNRSFKQEEKEQSVS